MLLEMNYDKIKVKTLCERAKINKNTFYRYYETLDFLIAEIIDEYSLKFIERTKKFKVPEDLESINREFFTFSVEQGEIYEKIICNLPNKPISEKFINQIINKTWDKSEKFQKLNKSEQNIIFSFIYNVGLEIYRQWIADGKKLSLEDIIEMSNKLLCRGIFGFFNV